MRKHEITHKPHVQKLKQKGDANTLHTSKRWQALNFSTRYRSVKPLAMLSQGKVQTPGDTPKASLAKIYLRRQSEASTTFCWVLLEGKVAAPWNCTALHLLTDQVQLLALPHPAELLRRGSISQHPAQIVSIGWLIRGGAGLVRGSVRAGRFSLVLQRQLSDLVVRLLHSVKGTRLHFDLTQRLGLGQGGNLLGEALVQRSNLCPLPSITAEESLLIHRQFTPLALVKGHEAVNTSLLDLQRSQHPRSSVVDAHWEDPPRLPCRGVPATSCRELRPVTHRLEIQIREFHHVCHRWHEPPQLVERRRLSLGKVHPNLH